jgi:hypothetical protein
MHEDVASQPKVAELVIDKLEGITCRAEELASRLQDALSTISNRTETPVMAKLGEEPKQKPNYPPYFARQNEQLDKLDNVLANILLSINSLEI